MKFCQHCGKEIMDEAVVCTGCGCAVNHSSVNQSTSTKAEKKTSAKKSIQCNTLNLKLLKVRMMNTIVL